MQTAHLTIHWMNPDVSPRSAQSALSVIRGVSDVSVSIENKEATVRYDPHKVLSRQFETAVRVPGVRSKRLSLIRLSDLHFREGTGDDENALKG